MKIRYKKIKGFGIENTLNKAPKLKKNKVVQKKGIVRSIFSKSLYNKQK